MNKTELKTEAQIQARINADVVELQISRGLSLLASERQIYEMGWKDGCKAALEHAMNELKTQTDPKKNTVADFKAGQRVAYVEFDGSRDYGTVSSVGGVSVFVKFDKTVKKLGWNGTTSQSVNPRDLVDASEQKQQPDMADIIP